MYTVQSNHMPKLTPAETQKLQAEADRRQAYIERQTAEYQADIVRVRALYEQGAPRKAPVVVAPQFTEAATRTVTRLPGGLKASAAADKAAVTRRVRNLDQSPEAQARRERRRQRRAARKARQAVAA